VTTLLFAGQRRRRFREKARLLVIALVGWVFIGSVCNPGLAAEGSIRPALRILPFEMRSGDSAYRDLGALMAASLKAYFVSIGWEIDDSEGPAQSRRQDLRQRQKALVAPPSGQSRGRQPLFEVSGYYSEYRQNIRVDAFARFLGTGKVVASSSRSFELRRLMDSVVSLGREFETEIDRSISSPTTFQRPRKTVLCYELEVKGENQAGRKGSRLQWLQREVPRYIGSRLQEVRAIDIFAPAETEEICASYRREFLKQDRAFRFDVFIAGSIQADQAGGLHLSSNIISVEGFSPLGPIEISGKLQDIFSLLDSYAASLKEVLTLSIRPDGNWNTDFAFMNRLPTPELIERADNLARQDSLEGAKLLYTAALHKNDPPIHAYLQLSEINAKQGRFPKAIGYLNSAIEIAPQNADVHLKLGDIRFQTQNYVSAQQAYEKAKPAAEAFDKLGDLFLFQGRHVEAINAYRQGLQRHPQNIDLRYSLGLAYNTRGEREKAIEALEALLALDPSHRKSSELLAKAYLEGAIEDNRTAVQIEETQPREAQRLYRRSIGSIQKSLRYEESGRAYAILGWCHFGLENHARAMEAYGKAIELSPELNWPHFGIGRIYLEQGKYGSAIDAFNDALKLDPQNSLALIYQARAHHAIGEDSKAVELLGEAWRISNRQERWRFVREAMDLAVKIEPHNGPFLVRAAEGHRLTGDPEGALELLQRALEINPSLAEAYSSRGLVHLQLGRTDKAIDDLNRALEIDPQNAASCTTLGKIYFQQAQPVIAIDLLSRALEIDGQNLEAHLLLGQIYKSLDDLDAAIEHFQQALDLDPANPDVYVDLGEAYRRNNDVNKAVASFQRAVQLDLTATQAYFHLGQIYHNECIENGCYQYDRALPYFAEANSRKNQLYDKEEALRYQGFYAESLVTNFDHDMALDHIEAVLKNTSRSSLRQDMLLLQTVVYLLQNRRREADESLEEFRASRREAEPLVGAPSRSYAGLRNFVLEHVDDLRKSEQSLIESMIQVQENKIRIGDLQPS